MELRWKDNKTKAVGIAFISDSDAEVLVAMGYYHDWKEDVQDDEKDGEWVEIWKPVKEESDIEYNFKVNGNKLCCRICGSKVGFKFDDSQWCLSSEAEGDEGKGICHTCLIEHCCNTNCSECDWYKYPNCPHIETKKIYMEED